MQHAALSVILNDCVQKGNVKPLAEDKSQGGSP